MFAYVSALVQSLSEGSQSLDKTEVTLSVNQLTKQHSVPVSSAQVVEEPSSHVTCMWTNFVNCTIDVMLIFPHIDEWKALDNFFKSNLLPSMFGEPRSKYERRRCRGKRSRMSPMNNSEKERKSSSQSCCGSRKVWIPGLFQVCPVDLATQ